MIMRIVGRVRLAPLAAVPGVAPGATDGQARLSRPSHDRQSRIGKFDKALDDADAKGWTVVDMKGDGKKVFTFK